MGKKVFVSCPMKGRTDENIRKTIDILYNIAKVYFGEPDLELIDSYNPDFAKNCPDGCNKSIYALGESIKKMAEADYFAGLYLFSSGGCQVEQFAAETYGLKMLTFHQETLQFLAPDMLESDDYEYEENDNDCLSEQTYFDLDSIEKYNYTIKNNIDKNNTERNEEN